MVRKSPGPQTKDKGSKMTKPFDLSSPVPETLREQAERLLASRGVSLPPPGPHELRRLPHELDIHNIELELQNEELRQKQLELMALHNKYYELYDLAPVGYLTCSATNLILETNHTLAELLGLAKKALIGKPLTAFILAEDQDIFYLHRRLLLANRQPLSCELRLKHPSADAFLWAQLELTMQPGAANDQLFIGVTDISRIKKSKVALLASQRELEELMARRTRELKAHHTQLLHTEKLAASGRLASSLAHEINNPLCGIQNVLEVVAKYSSVSGEIKELVDLALSECQRIKQLIVNLQTFNRPSSGLREPTDLNGVISLMLKMCAKACGKAGIKVTTALAADLPPVMAVTDQIKQVLLNIFQNAIDAMAAAGGTLTVRTEWPAPWAKIQISDTGHGIADHELPYIFEPFISSKPALQGTGLGLSISHGIIKQHGGKILVSTEPGRGTTFSLLLPLTTDDGGEAAEAAAPK